MNSSYNAIIIDLNYNNYEYNKYFDILKPGGFLIPLFNIKKYHRETTQIEDAGFEIRDMVSYLNEKKPILIPVCRKPITEKTVAQNILKYDTGGINTDGCRIDSKNEPRDYLNENSSGMDCGNSIFGKSLKKNILFMKTGRFPANIIHDGNDKITNLFPNTKPSKSAFRGLEHSGRHGGLADIGSQYN